MDQQRLEEMIRRIGTATAAREPVETMFVALRRFERQVSPYNRLHLATPSPKPEEWRAIYERIEPHAAELALTLAAHRDSLSPSLVTVLDGIAGLIDEAAARGIDVSSILMQVRVQDALKKLERVPSKLNVFLYSWGRPTLREYQGEAMQRAVELATFITRETGYFAGYLARLLDRAIITNRNDGR